MKKYTKIILSLIIVISVMVGILSGVARNKAPGGISSRDSISEKDTEILELESRKSFDFFWNEANSDKKSTGYGLIRDRAPGDSNIASIASVGYGLSALTIGAERKWVPYEEAKERALGTLNTLLSNVQNEKGFFYHFVNMNTAKREWSSEASIIDTAIALCGAINAGEYFGGEVKQKSDEIYRRVDWTWYTNPKTNEFYMGYTPEKGFFGAWDMAAEQFMMYFLGAGSPTHPISGDMFYAFNRKATAYGFYPPFIQSPAGSIFTYQFSFAWFDMRNKVDKQGVNWWTNSLIASKASRQYSIDNSRYFKTFGENSWGVTASDGPQGYSGAYGANSSGNDGTIAPSGAAGSIVFTPKETIGALNNYYNNQKQLWGKYGFKDAYNIDVSPAWYDTDYIGIDKGITLLMIENYRNGLIWKNFMKNKYVLTGMKKAGLSDIDTKGKPTAESIVIDGTPPIVGQTLKASYVFYSPNGVEEGNTTYKWLIASSRDGEYKEISGENSLTYVVRKEDVGKYIKFQVKPKAKLSFRSLLSQKGPTAVSDAVGAISEKDPRMFKKKEKIKEDADMTKSQSSAEITAIDNFDGSRIAGNWNDGGDGAYALSVVNGDAENSSKVLKIEYTKGDKDWAFYYDKFDDAQDFSSYSGINAKVKGTVSFILKFEDASGQGIVEKKFTANGNDKWQELQWNFAGTEDKLKSVKRVLIFAAPGEKDANGSFFMDDISLIK